MRVHTGEKPYVCTVPGCGKAFHHRAGLRGHEKSHERDKEREEREAPRKAATSEEGMLIAQLNTAEAEGRAAVLEKQLRRVLACVRQAAASSDPTAAAGAAGGDAKAPAAFLGGAPGATVMKSAAFIEAERTLDLLQKMRSAGSQKERTLDLLQNMRSAGSQTAVEAAATLASVSAGAAQGGPSPAKRARTTSSESYDLKPTGLAAKAKTRPGNGWAMGTVPWATYTNASSVPMPPAPVARNGVVAPRPYPQMAGFPGPLALQEETQQQSVDSLQFAQPAPAQAAGQKQVLVQPCAPANQPLALAGGALAMPSVGSSASMQSETGSTGLVNSESAASFTSALFPQMGSSPPRSHGNSLSLPISRLGCDDHAKMNTDKTEAAKRIIEQPVDAIAFDDWILAMDILAANPAPSI